VEFLDLDGALVAYRVGGAGPPLLAPECNYTWDDVVESRLAERFTLIVASPRDYGRSTRTGGPGYDVGRWATDLRAVARHLGYDRFLFFGYSFTGAFGPWLARRLRDHGAVAAVAAGGFPLLVNYGVTLADVENQARAFEQDPAALAQISLRFDPLAARAFYRDLATLPPDTLVDDLPCPLYCFWGDRDTDAVEMVLSHEKYMAGLSQRSVPFDVYAGYDHEGLNDSLDIALPAAMEWLTSQANELGL
jgi:pimeloyl-ACP methyl ester carboxylesterase